MDAVRDLGRRYMTIRPDDEKVEQVASMLTQDVALEQVEALRRDMHADFAAERIVNLDGWFLSETEGRLFAALSRCAS